jgi:hypothetical protein
MGRDSEKERAMFARPRPPVVGVSVLAVAIALIVAACGGDNTVKPIVRPSSGVSSAASVAPSAATSAVEPPPTSTPQPTTTPSVDVAKAFVASLSRGLSAEARLDGSVTVGAISLPVSGTSLLAGRDSHQTMTITTGARAQVTETITVDGQSYTKQGKLWFAKPAKGGGDLGAVLNALSSLVDTGTETKDGRNLHRLAPPPGTAIPMSALGAASAGATDGNVALEFYAEDDGTPAIISLDASWTQKVGKVDQPASMHLDMFLSRVGQTITIAPPETVWVTTASRRLGYRVARPSDWDVEFAKKATANDWFYGPDGDVVAVYREANCRCKLNAISAEFIRYERTHVKSFKVVSNSAAKVGGLRARVIESRGTYPNGRSWDLTYLVVWGRAAYVLDYSSDAPLTAQDRATAADMIGSVVFR